MTTRTFTPLSERFWRRVDKSGDCWLWTGAKTFGGYGVIRRAGARGELVRAHRFSLSEVIGDIPAKAVVCHRCDNPACVRPDHLFLGSQTDNMRDCSMKGRARGGGPKGELHHQAKLTEESVRQIRQRRDEGKTFIAIATEFGVSKKTILNIVHGRIWKMVA